ncbi:copper transporter [Arsenicicoccus piscis]
MRADGSTNAAVSTVDDLELPMGQAATIIALQQQLVGKVGRYGLTKDAQGPIPALTP